MEVSRLRSGRLSEKKKKNYPFTLLHGPLSARGELQSPLRHCRSPHVAGCLNSETLHGPWVGAQGFRADDPKPHVLPHGSDSIFDVTIMTDGVRRNHKGRVFPSGCRALPFGPQGPAQDRALGTAEAALRTKPAKKSVLRITVRLA